MAQETSMVQVFWRRVRETPEKTAILHKVDGSYRSVCWREHGRMVELLSSGLFQQGLNPQDKVTIMSHTRPQWTWADLSVLSLGGVTVPIYPTVSCLEAQFLVRHSDAVGAFVENERQARKILETTEPYSHLRFIVVMDGPVPDIDSPVRCLRWNALFENGKAHWPDNAGEIARRISMIGPGDLASIVYSSGTTGIPKGAMLPHSALYSVCAASNRLVKLTPNDMTLSFLPLSHVYERVGGQFLAIYAGVAVAYAESLENVQQNLVEVRPTVINAVPRFYEKAYQRIQAEIRHLPKPQQYLVRWALSLARRAARYTGTDHEDLVRKIYRAELRVADRLVFSKIRHRLGGRLRIMVSGAAPLSAEVQSFFETIGLPILEGYGLTETAAPIACNETDDNHPGTVGKPLPGLDIKIAEDGEILVRGPSVFTGYYKNEEATRLAFQDGWFMTGDIGEFDSNGCLKIRDRKKDIIITAGGKHIAPQFIENLFKGEDLIANVVVYGDRRKYITALITLHREGLQAFARANEITYSNFHELVHHQRIIAAIDELITRKNEELANFERIKKYVVLDEDFSAEANEVTPTFKLKRKVITDKYRDILNGMYDAIDLELEDGTAS